MEYSVNFNKKFGIGIKSIKSFSRIEEGNILVKINPEDIKRGDIFTTGSTDKTLVSQLDSTDDVFQCVNPITKTENGDDVIVVSFVNIHGLKEKVALLIDDRYFVKYVNNQEIDIDPHNLKNGDIFSLYFNKEKIKKCYWGDCTVFVCEDGIFSNSEDVEYISCSLFLEKKEK